MPDLTRPNRLYSPRRAHVSAADDGRPTAYDGTAVDSIREEWLVEDRWWTAQPFRRRYFELVLENGRNVVVFCLVGAGKGAPAGGWYRQRG